VDKLLTKEYIDINVSEQHVSVITFIKYAQSQKIGKTNKLNKLGAMKPKGLNRRANIS
jgi:hypothetical protein